MKTSNDQIKFHAIYTVVILFICSFNCAAKGTLSKNHLFNSKHLDYELYYRVYTPNINLPLQQKNYPTLYLTDGQWYITKGDIINILDREIESKRIPPMFVIFVDSRNPLNTKENRRNTEFMCNEKYINFFVNELVPTVQHNFPVSNSAKDRGIAGISFGGLNAACFGLLAAKHFGKIGMKSPANSQHLKTITKLYKDLPVQPIRIFLSSGDKNDNLPAIKKFYKALLRKGYNVEFKKVSAGHNWRNWRALIDDMLQSLF